METYMTKHKIVKATTTYYVSLPHRNDTVSIAVNDEGNGMSIYDGIEPCSGVLRHWGSKAELRAELMELVEILDEM